MHTAFLAQSKEEALTFAGADAQKAGRGSADSWPDQRQIRSIAK